MLDRTYPVIQGVVVEGENRVKIRHLNVRRRPVTCQITGCVDKLLRCGGRDNHPSMISQETDGVGPVVDIRRLHSAGIWNLCGQNLVSSTRKAITLNMPHLIYSQDIIQPGHQTQSGLSSERPQGEPELQFESA